MKKFISFIFISLFLTLGVYAFTESPFDMVYFNNNFTSNINNSEYLQGYQWANAPYPSSIYSTYNATYDSKNSSQWTTTGSNIYYNLGNVGIKTSSPSYLLSLGKDMGDKLAVYDNGVNTIYGFGIGAGRMYIKAGNTEVINIMGGSGNKVGIGTSSPSTKLEVVGDGNFSGTIYLNNAINLLGLVNNASYLSTYNFTYDLWAYNQTISAIDYTNINFYNKTSNINATGYNITANYFFGDGSQLTGIVGGGGNSSYNATYDAKNSSQWTTTGSNIYYNLGNVGIGIVSPIYALDVTSRVRLNNTIISSGPGTDVVMGDSTAGNVGTATGGNNMVIGTQAGKALTSGYYNVIMGREAGSKITSGLNNFALGYKALNGVTTTSGNVAIGTQSLEAYTGSETVGIGGNALRYATTGTKNTAIGYNSGFRITSGASNTFIGWNAGYGVNTTNNNIAIGEQTLNAGTTANDNVAIGLFALREGTDADHNVAIGSSAGRYNTGDNAVMIGSGAGRQTATTDLSGSVFIGYQAGYSETTTNKLYIENSNSATPLIWGDFSTDEVKINGELNITKQLIVANSEATYPIEAYGSNDISIYAQKNISATGFITRTSIYDVSKDGKALDKMISSSDYITNGKINHSKFYGYVKWETIDKTKSIITIKEIEDCKIDEISKIKECEKRTIEEISYPFKKIEEGVDLGKEIDLLRQALYELKVENEQLRIRVTNLEKV